MSEREHALLSASGSSRWIACTPSAVLEDGLAEEKSEYAAEGTFAHSLADLELSFALKKITGKTYKKRRLVLKENAFYDASMEQYVQQYVTVVMEKVAEAKTRCKDALVMLEQKLDYSDWAPDGFGTGDVVIIADGILEVIDLKYGKGVAVDAENNSQLRLYGLGALSGYGMLYDLQSLKMTIMQPRLDSISTEELSTKSLSAWGEEIKPKAELAFKGEGEFFAGSHCQFCRAKATCRARAETNLALTKYDFMDGCLLEDIEIAEILTKAKQLQAWASDICSHALDQAVNHGKHWDGWKLVEGKSSRKYTDEIIVAETLKKAGYEETSIYIKKLLGITAMEKEIGKKVFNTLLSGFLIKPAGTPTLVHETDKRAELCSVAKAAADFK